MLLAANSFIFLSQTPLARAQGVPDSIGQPGVSRALAAWRGSHLRDIHYVLHFRIPAARQEPVNGWEEVSFTLDKKSSGGGSGSGSSYGSGFFSGGGPLLLDFKGGPSAISEVRLNGHAVPVIDTNEHLLLSSALLHAGVNTVDIRFTAGNAALNRNGEFLYTLLVPDRARTLFPCFDQPDLKAVFTLSLDVPAGWKAMGNALLLDTTVKDTAVKDTTGKPDNCQYRFHPSDRISTYLFSFVAGKFSESERVVDGRPMHFLYREQAAA